MLLFFKKDVPQSFGGSLALAGYTDETVHYEPDGLHLVRAHAFVTAPLTAGSIQVSVYIGLTVCTLTLQPGKPRDVATPTKGVDPGGHLSVGATASADLAPTTTDLLVVLD